VAEDKGREDGFAPEIDDLDEGDQDVIFKAQMGVYQFFATWWKQLLGGLGIFLAGTLAYSLISDHQREEQRDLHAEISDIERRMPTPDPLAAYGMAPLDDPEDEERIANLREGARRYDVIATDGRGAAATMASLKAAGAWQRAGDAESELASLQLANESSGSGILGWSAASQLAAAKMAAGDVDGAAAVLTAVNQSTSGIIGEKALLDLGLMYESAERADDAIKTLEDFTARYPESALLMQAAEALGRLKG
jgi:tetratricopeptide (TPR) repeat protein